MHRLTSSCLVTISPKNKNAIIAAKIGEVLFRKATLDNEIILTATLNMKKVIVPEIARTMTKRHCSSGILVRLTRSLIEIK